MKTRILETNLRLTFFTAITVLSTSTVIAEAETKPPAASPTTHAALSVPVSSVKPRIITHETRHDSDDPAIWIHPKKPAQSLIIGTDKHRDGALYLFDLEGKIVKRVGDLKRPNNVDVAHGVKLGKKRVDLAVTTERLAQRLRVYTLPEMRCIDRGDLLLFDGDNSRAPMGIALYTRPSDGALFAIVSGKNGPLHNYLAQYRLLRDQEGYITMTLVREFGNYSGKQEIEAVAVDNELGYVYYSDEKFGVRKYHADPDAPNAQQELALFGTQGFKRDQKGIAIYKVNNGTGYIIVSDQQAQQMQIFTREGTPQNPHDHRLVKIVKVEALVTDGCDVTNAKLAPLFPNGVFVAMSDDKTFHYYAWEDIAGPDLMIAPNGKLRK